MPIYGTNGSETIDWWDGTSAANDTIFAYGGNDNIWAYGGADTIFAGDGSDNVIAGSGNDMLKGGGGADYMDGGSGTDTADYSDSSVGVQVYLTTGAGYGGTAEGDTLVDIENLNGSSHEDFLVGNDGANVLNGLGDNDILKGGGGADELNGGSGNDTLKGGGGADVLNGGSGTDTAAYNESSAGVTVLLYTDTASGGDAEGDELNSIENVTGSAYADNLWGNDGANVLRGMNGNDSLKGFGGADTLWGGEGHDDLYGMDGVDTLRGEDGNDYMDGGASADTMIGGLGNDTYIVDNAGDAVTEFGGQGADVVRASVSWTMTAGADVETLRTTDDAGFDAIDLTGNSSGNVIIGNNGANFLNGGDGNDELSGLGSHDVFVFNTALNAASNVDVITDFDPSDEYIYIDNAIFSNLGAEPDHFILSDEFHLGTAAGDADDHIIYDSATGAIYYDSDGTGAAMQVQFAEVTPGTSLAHDNFHVF
jgi:Ca2+-binding RTX toxin-like protein